MTTEPHEASPSNRIQEVDTRAGYYSEAAFNRPFKRTSGSPAAASQGARLVIH